MGAPPKYPVGVPTLDAIIAEPGCLAALPVEVLATLSSRAAAIQSILASALTTKVVQNGRGTTRARGINDAGASRTEDSDTLLSATEAAKRIGMSLPWMYRHAAALPFTVRQGRALRFSANGIETYIRVRLGR